ncbi:MAG: tRNA (cytidine(34)-2'-O)-methyltransferase [Bacteriovoracaceae bacterium]
MTNASLFNVVLVAPDIPGNTGSIGRTCVALNLHLHLIKPLGFDISEKAVRRAGLDYWKYVQISEYDSWDHFIEMRKPAPTELFFFSKFGEKVHYQGNYESGCYLIFGSESMGLPLKLTESYETRLFQLPMYTDKIRSLNLANAATAACYEALRQIKFL